MWAWHYLNLQNALAVLIRGSVAIVLTSRFSQRRFHKYLCFSSSAICTPTDCWYNFYHLLSGIIAFGLLLHFPLMVTEGSSFCFMFFFWVFYLFVYYITVSPCPSLAIKMYYKLTGFTQKLMVSAPVAAQGPQGLEWDVPAESLTMIFLLHLT